MFVFIISAVLTYIGIKFIVSVASATKTKRAEDAEPARKNRALDFKW